MSDDIDEFIRLLGEWEQGHDFYDFHADVSNAIEDARTKALAASNEAWNAALDHVSEKLVQDFKHAFGADTCASWAAWLKEQKK
jgi:hypothetical protein